MKIIAFILLTVIGLMFAWAISACSEYEIGPSCHLGHLCTTDGDCEDEEAYFLDLDELRQGEEEIINLRMLEEETTK